MKKMRLTIFLIIANIAVFFTILKLEFSDNIEVKVERPLIEISTMEFYGKALGEPRILKINKNKWEILSPMKWDANSFAVNRILRNIETLDDSVGFWVKDLARREQSLADYGLEDPICTCIYGNDKVKYSLKIGNTASVGNKVYMLDSYNDKILVVDSQVADDLMEDIDKLRSQNILSIPIQEISAIRLKLPVKDLKTQAKANSRMVGLNRDSNRNWNFEAPFKVDASNEAVAAFLRDMSAAYIKSFNELSDVEAGLDTLSVPISISLGSNNDEQTLLLGHMNKDTHSVYAKLANNPTIFTLDSTPFESLDRIEFGLRNKEIMKFSQRACTYIEISSADSMVTLKKLSGDTWDVSGKIGDKLSVLRSADNTKINRLLATLANTVARRYISDSDAEDLAIYGLDKANLKISLGFNDDGSEKKTLLIGKEFKESGASLYYAKVESEPSIYAISAELINNYKPKPLDYRAKLLYSLPENANLLSIELKDIATGELILNAKEENGSFNNFAETLLPKDRELFKKLLAYAKTFYVKNFVSGTFTEDACVIAGETYPWSYALNVTMSMPGTGGDEVLTESILLSDRLGSGLQYALYKDELFELHNTMINALYFLGATSMPKQFNQK